MSATLARWRFGALLALLLPTLVFGAVASSSQTVGDICAATCSDEVTACSTSTQCSSYSPTLSSIVTRADIVDLERRDAETPLLCDFECQTSGWPSSTVGSALATAALNCLKSCYAECTPQRVCPRLVGLCTDRGCNDYLDCRLAGSSANVCAAGVQNSTSRALGESIVLCHEAACLRHAEDSFPPVGVGIVIELPAFVEAWESKAADLAQSGISPQSKDATTGLETYSKDFMLSNSGSGLVYGREGQLAPSGSGPFKLLEATVGGQPVPFNRVLSAKSDSNSRFTKHLPGVDKDPASFCEATCQPQFSACDLDADCFAMKEGTFQFIDPLELDLQNCDQACQDQILAGLPGSLNLKPAASSLALFEGILTCFTGCMGCNWATECPNVFGLCFNDAQCFNDTQAPPPADTPSLYNNLRSCGLAACQALDQSGECGAGFVNDQPTGGITTAFWPQMETASFNQLSALTTLVTGQSPKTQTLSTSRPDLLAAAVVVVPSGPYHVSDTKTTVPFSDRAFLNAESRLITCRSTATQTCLDTCAAPVRQCALRSGCGPTLGEAQAVWDTNVTTRPGSCTGNCVTAFTPTGPADSTAYIGAAACVVPCMFPGTYPACSTTCFEEIALCDADPGCGRDVARELAFSQQTSTSSPPSPLDNLVTCLSPTLQCPASLTVPPDAGRRGARLTLSLVANAGAGIDLVSVVVPGTSKPLHEVTGSSTNCNFGGTLPFTAVFEGQTNVAVELKDLNGISRTCSFTVTIVANRVATQNLLATEALVIANAVNTTALENATADLAGFKGEDLDGTDAVIFSDTLKTIIRANNGAGVFRNRGDVDSATTRNIFNSFDNLMELRRNNIQDAEDSEAAGREIAETVDEFGSQIAGQLSAGEKFALKGSRINLTATVVNRGGGEDVVFDNGDGATPATMKVPSGALDGCASALLSVVISVLEDDRWLTADDGNQAASNVISGTIDGCDTAVLVEPVEFTLTLTANSGDTVFCAFYNTTLNVWSTEGVTTEGRVDDVLSCKTTHLTNFAVLVDSTGSTTSTPASLSIVSLLCAALSCFFLLVALVTHGVFKGLRNTIPSKLLFQLCLALFVALLLFLIQGLTDVSDEEDTCTAVAVLMHYFWLSAVLWMLVQAINLHAVTVIVLGLDMGKRLLAYQAFAWGLPLLIVAISVGAAGKGAYGGASFCWINSSAVLYGAFLAPLAVVMVVNVVLFVLIMRVVMETGRRRRKRHGSMADRSARAEKRRELRSAVSLSFLLGLSWLFGAFIDTGDADSSLAFQYIFSIVTALQGFFIFLFYCAWNPQATAAYRSSFGLSSTSKYSGTSDRRTSKGTNSHSAVSSSKETTIPMEFRPAYLSEFGEEDSTMEQGQA